MVTSSEMLTMPFPDTDTRPSSSSTPNDSSEVLMVLSLLHLAYQSFWGRKEAKILSTPKGSRKQSSKDAVGETDKVGLWLVGSDVVGRCVG